jgi:hypothetical protein
MLSIGSHVEWIAFNIMSNGVHFYNCDLLGFDDVYSLLQNVKSHVYSGVNGMWNVVSLNISHDG